MLMGGRWQRVYKSGKIGYDWGVLIPSINCTAIYVLLEVNQNNVSIYYSVLCYEYRVIKIYFISIISECIWPPLTLSKIHQLAN